MVLYIIHNKIVIKSFNWRMDIFARRIYNSLVSLWRQIPPMPPPIKNIPIKT